jgi:hypothetical protein
VLRCVVLVVVDAEDDGEVLVAGRGGDDHLLDGAAEVGLCFFGVCEEAGGFDDDLCAYAGPVELCRVALGEDLDLLAVDGDEVFAVGDLVFEVAEDGIVLEEMRERGRCGEVVYGDEFDVRVAESGAEDVASDAAEAVDAYLYCHDCDCSCRDECTDVDCRTRWNGLYSIRWESIIGVEAAQTDARNRELSGDPAGATPGVRLEVEKLLS